MLENRARQLISGLVLTAVVTGLGAAVAPGAVARNVSEQPCDEDASVQVSYGLVAEDPRYVTAVVLSDLGSACAHANIKVALFDEGGTELVRVQSRHNGSSPQISLDLPTIVAAQDVHRVDVVVAGAKRQ